jgi:hypothetical protein
LQDLNKPYTIYYQTGELNERPSIRHR